MTADSWGAKNLTWGAAGLRARFLVKSAHILRFLVKILKVNEADFRLTRVYP